MENLTAIRNKYIQICEEIENLIDLNLGGWVLMEDGYRKQVKTPWQLNKNFELEYVTIELTNIQPNDFFVKLYYTDETLNETIEFCNFDNWENKITDYINYIIENHSN